MRQIRLTTPESARAARETRVNVFGTETRSFTDQIRTPPGDVFKVEAEGFGRPLRNALSIAASPSTAAETLYAAAPGEPEPLRKAAS